MSFDPDTKYASCTDNGLFRQLCDLIPSIINARNTRLSNPQLLSGPHLRPRFVLHCTIPLGVLCFGRVHMDGVMGCGILAGGC